MMARRVVIRPWGEKTVWEGGTWEGNWTGQEGNILEALLTFSGLLIGQVFRVVGRGRPQVVAGVEPRPHH